jgi:membrane-bound inhibitor of C-type lysozyme
MTRASFIDPRFVGLAVAMALATGVSHAAADTAVAYTCANGKVVVADFGVEKGRVLLTIGKHRVMLAQGRSGSGARYTNGKTTFWIKGNSARLIEAGHETTCHVTDD